MSKNNLKLNKCLKYSKLSNKKNQSNFNINKKKLNKI